MQVSVLPFIHDGEDADQLMSRADRGMYTVKNLGYNRYHQFVAAQN
jgi:GGDEF domain-containing protein